MCFSFHFKRCKIKKKKKVISFILTKIVLDILECLRNYTELHHHCFKKDSKLQLEINLVTKCKMNVNLKKKIYIYILIIKLKK